MTWHRSKYPVIRAWTDSPGPGSSGSSAAAVLAARWYRAVALVVFGAGVGGGGWGARPNAGRGIPPKLTGAEVPNISPRLPPARRAVGGPAQRHEPAPRTSGADRAPCSPGGSRRGLSRSTHHTRSGGGAARPTAGDRGAEGPVRGGRRAGWSAGAATGPTVAAAGGPC